MYPFKVLAQINKQINIKEYEAKYINNKYTLGCN